MSEARLPAHLEVTGLLRAAQAEGGFGAVLARGERDAGTILLLTIERGREPKLWERQPMLAGNRAFHALGVRFECDSDMAEYLAKRRRQDPDLWIVEVDIAEPQRFVANQGT